MTMVMASALLAASSALGQDASCPSGESCVVVKVLGESSRTFEFSISNFDQAANVRTRQNYSYKGSGDVLLTVLPVRDLLNQLGTPVADISFVELSSSTAAPRSNLVVADGDLDDPGPFAGGLLPAIYTANGTDGTRFGYTRGQRSASDDNGRDTIITASDLQITVHTTGKPLFPVVTASPSSQPTSNRPVTFSVDVENAPGARYTWDFGDGTTLEDSTEARPTHQYTRTTTTGQDSFTARVTVTGDDSSTGSSRPITVTIGSPKPGTGSKPGTGESPDKGAPATGPETSKGDTQGSKPSKSPGGAGTGATDTGSSGQPAAPRTDEVLTGSPQPELVQPNDGLIQVSGILLGQVDASGHVVQTPEQAAADRTAAAARQSAKQDFSMGPVLVGLSLLALVGIGGLTETAWWRRRLDQIIGRLAR